MFDFSCPLPICPIWSEYLIASLCHQDVLSTVEIPFCFTPLLRGVGRVLMGQVKSQKEMPVVRSAMSTSPGIPVQLHLPFPKSELWK